eukprot:TRINITY_DN34433_c0_g1_i1.p1 TRINITY_DN34433_c0_g1~~TRINITY_DN34433_c0_g1_i1.p1  ORF type:complete len:159 (-),score=66.49 TRINITY_DN34433_c0_g1_i1:123-599(-)
MLRSLVGSEMCIRDSVTSTMTKTLAIQPTTTTTTNTTSTTTTTTAAPLPNEVKYSVQGSNFTAEQIRDAVAADLNISSTTVTVVSDVGNGTTRFVVLAFSTSSAAASALQRANDGALSSVGVTGASPVSPTSSPSCLLYTSDAADEEDSVDLGGGRII